MKNHKIAFIGAGHMASSLITGLINDGFPENNILVSNPTPEKLSRLKQQFPGMISNTDNKIIAESAQTIILTVNPMNALPVVQELSSIILKNKPLLISTAAGITTENLQKACFGSAAIVRCIPNACALVGSAVTGLYASTQVNDEQHDVAESILRAVGVTVWVAHEAQLDIITALSGSGPAYYFYFMEILENIGIKMGLSKEIARLLTLQTAFGSSKLALSSGQEPAHLREQIMTKGGTTEAALSIMMKSEFAKICDEALQAAKKRAHELSELM